MSYTTKGNGAPIIFLPGLFAGGWIWNSVVSNMINSGYSTITFNEAIPIAFEGSIHRALNELDNIVNNSKLPCCIVGNSLGALIALHFAFKKGTDKIRKVIMSGSPGQLEMETGVSLSDLHTGDEEYARILVSHVFHNIKKVAPNIIEKGTSEIKELFHNNHTFNNIVRWLLFSRKYDVPAVLNQISLPIDLIWGEYDKITPIKPWVDITNDFSNLSMEIIEDSGHSPMLEDPVLFSHSLLTSINSYT